MCQERGAKEISQMKKQANQIAIRKEASLAALAWSKLETAAQEQLNGDVPALQLVVDARGVTAIIRDEHGTTVTVQEGRISVNVAAVSDPE
jgi:hypothetical protein